MGAIARISAAWSALTSPPPAPAARPVRRRAYHAAKHSRLTADWTRTNVSSDAELRQDLPVLRARSRQLANDNDYARRFYRVLHRNVLGPNGIMLRPMAVMENGEPDLAARQTVREWWRNWGRRGVCTVCGRFSWLDVLRICLNTMARDGEILIQHVTGARARNEFGYALKLIEPDYLDHTVNRTERGRTKIRLGVEYDRDRRPIAYHLLASNPGDYGSGELLAGRTGHARLPADRITHLFIGDRVEQSRGVPWMHTAAARLNMAGKYEEAELVAARAASAKMGFYYSEDGDSFDADDEDDDGGELIEELEPGVMRQLPDGMRVEAFDPQHPTSAYEPFVRGVLRGAAAGVDVSYPTLANDPAGVNYTGLRHFALDDRDGWRGTTEYLIDALCEPVFHRAAGRSMLTGALTLPARAEARLLAHKFRGRGWRWVDPDKDSKGADRDIRNGLRSQFDVMEEQGREPEETLDEIAEFEAMAAARGITLATSVSATGSGNDDERDEGDGNDPDAEADQDV